MSPAAHHFTKYGLWVIFALPALYITNRFHADILSYGQVIHLTGEYSVFFLFTSLCVTPCRRAFSRARWPLWLMSHRRAMGVASFGYAALHTIVYLERKWGYGLILKEGQRPELLTGWMAMFIFLALAITSNNSSVKALKRGWHKLHRFVYLAAILTFVHWLLASYELFPALLIAGGLLAIQVLRFVKPAKGKDL